MQQSYSDLSLVGLQNGLAPLGDSLAISWKTTHTPSIRLSSCAPWFLLKGVKNLYKNLHMDANSRFIYHCQNLETTNMFIIGEWINKLWYNQAMGY